MIEFFKQFAELLREALAYLELDEGYAPESIRAVELEILTTGNCFVRFPDIKVEYFASNWDHLSGKRADWLFVR